MAVLSKIRQRSLLLIGVIGFCLLAFVIGDVVQSGGLTQSSNYVGSVNGDDISAQEFLQKVAQLEKSQQGISNTQASNSVWEQDVKNILLDVEFEKLGLKIGKDQLINVMKQNPQFASNPQFLNAAGLFDLAKFNEFLATLKNAQPEQWKAWLDFEKQVAQAATEQMYYTLLKAGMYTTKLEGKLKYEQENNTADFSYVTLSYASIKDDEAKVSDKEIMAYVNKNAKKYKSEPSRELEYVFVDNTPSKADQAEMKTKMDALLKGSTLYNAKTGQDEAVPSFANATDVVAYVNANSDIKYDSTYIAKKDLPLEHQEKLFNLASGQIYGPYVFNNYYCLSKMIAKKAGETAKASHILIAYAGSKVPTAGVKRTKEEAQKLATQLLQQVQANPGTFPLVAMQNTDDPGSKQTGGAYDNITKGQMVKPFNDFVFGNAAGKIGIVETDFGFHIIKVDAKYDAVRMATIAQKIEPSEATADANFNKAAQIEADANDTNLEAAAKKAKIAVQNASVKGADEAVATLGAQRGIILWAFNNSTDEGDVKKFDTPQGHVIAQLKSKNDSGVISLEEAKAIVTPILVNEKKAAILKEKLAGTSLEAIASKTKASIVSAKAVSIENPMLANIGIEPKVVGKAFGLAKGKISEPIEGQLGVYVVKTNQVVKAPALPNYQTYVAKLKSQNQGAVQGRTLFTLKENAKIEDNRVRFQ